MPRHLPTKRLASTLRVHRRRISASRYGKRRPAWEAVKSELRKGDVLVTWEASRSTRDLEEYVQLRKLGVELGVKVCYSGRILDLSNGDDRFMSGLDVLVAEKESEQIKARVLRGKQTSADAGHPSGRAPWGYRTKPREPGKRPEWEPDPREAPRLQEAVRRLLKGATMYAVMRWIESSDGFTPSSITNLKRSLTNPALAGLRVHRGEIVGPGTWDPIISVTEREQLLKELDTQPATRPGPEPKHLLSGIAKCGVCGEGLRWKRYQGKRNPGYECYRGHCSREAGRMEAAVTQELFTWLPAVYKLLSEHAAATAEAQRKIAELQDQIKGWREAAIRGEVTPESFADIERGLLQRIEEQRGGLSPGLVNVFDPQMVMAAWPTMSMRRKRFHVRLALDITVVPAERRGARTGQLLIEPGGELGINPITWK
jgi:site-specific DNA recombinase